MEHLSHGIDEIYKGYVKDIMGTSSADRAKSASSVVMNSRQNGKSTMTHHMMKEVERKLNAEQPLYIPLNKDIVIDGETYKGSDLKQLLDMLPFLRKDYSASQI